MENAEISEGRKATYYIGMAMVVIGIILFISTFFSFISLGESTVRHFSQPTITYPPGQSERDIPVRRLLNLPPKPKRAPTVSEIFIRAIGGMALIFFGGILMTVGRFGAAGSGIVLDPGKTRSDLKPWSQMKGGMLDDVLSQSETVNKVIGNNHEIVKVRCRSCGTLNDETAKFCDECGTQM